MGGNNQKQKQTLSNFKYMISKSDLAYGDIALYQHKFNSQQYMAVIKLLSDNIHNSDKYQNKINHPNITELYDVYESNVTDLCGTLNIIHIGLEYLQKSLCKDIEIRRKLKTSYFEGEIWYILKTSCQTLLDMEIAQQQYLDFHPQNIRITEDGNIKFLDLRCTPNFTTGLRKVKHGLRGFEYLAPEQLEIFNSAQKSEASLDYQKINVFLLGLLCVICLTNLDSKQIYDTEKIIFQYNLVATKLKNIIHKYRYSIQLEELLISTLNYNPFDRPNYLKILSIISNLDQQMISNHLYVKCSQQPTQLESTNRILLSSEIRSARSPNEKISMDDTKTQFSNEQNSICKFKRTQPQIHRFSLTPEPQQQQYQQIKPIPPNYSQIDPIIESTLRKSRALISYYQNTPSITQSQQRRSSSTSTSKYTPMVASLNIKEEQSFNYINVKQLLKQSEMKNSNVITTNILQ